MPIILEYKQAKSNQNSNFIEINVSLDEYNVPEIKAMEVFETLGIEYQRENLFLEGSGMIIIEKKHLKKFIECMKMNLKMKPKL